MADINKVKISETTYDLADTRIAIGTCPTAAGTATKVVTITSPSNWTLRTGAMISVKFTNTNTASSPKLNVNSTGAKSIYYNNAVYTSASSYGGYANRYITYQYDGTNWVFISWGYDSNSDIKATQTRTSTDKNYPVIFAYSDANKDESQTVRKNLAFTYNPSLNSLSTGKKTNTALGSNSAAIGNGVTASGPSSFATGSNTIAAGECSHAEGMGGIEEPITTSLTGSAPMYTINPTNENIVPHMAIDCNGKSSIIISYDHSTGTIETFTNLGVLEGAQATIYFGGATGSGSHVEGSGTFASGESSHAEGSKTIASNMYAHAEGYRTTASGAGSHAEGDNSVASGTASHAEGRSTASGHYSHAEGYKTTASETNSHAEGDNTTASGWSSHAEGNNTTASGGYAHAEGELSLAQGVSSHAEGTGTVARSRSQHVQGEYNIIPVETVDGRMGTYYAHIVGNGTDDDNRSNAHTLDWNGNAWFAGSVSIGANRKAVVTTDGSLKNPTSLTVKGNGTTSFTYNGSTAKTLNIKAGTNTSVSSDTSGNITINVPTASDTVAGATIVHPAVKCTTFSSDSGTVTPLAVQKGAELFAITRPPKRGTGNPANPGNPGTCTTNNIVRWLNAAGDVQDSKIKIEDVTNTRDTSKKAQVIAIPAEGNKKMVYGYCTDQVDGTSFIGGVFANDATEYPYNQGLAIGGTSGNLLWKGKQVATTDMITADTKNTTGTTDTSSKIYLAGATSQAANPQTYSHNTVYVDTDGHLYSNSKQAVNLSDTQALTNKTYNGYTLGAACAKGVVTSVASGNTNLVTSGGVYATTSTLAPKASPALTGTPTAPTAAAGTNTTQIATTAFVKTALDNKITYGTADLTEGTSTLTTGNIYLVYE